MGFQNAAATVTLSDKTFANWQPGSEWTLRSEKSGEDDDAVEAMTTKRIIGDVPRDVLRKAARENRLAEVVPISEVQLMSVKSALLSHMSVSWSGPEFTLPKNHPLFGEDGKVLLDKKSGKPKIDPHAGSVPPCTAYYVRQQDSYLLTDAYEHLVAIWAGRTPEENESFPGRLAVVGGASEGSA